MKRKLKGAVAGVVAKASALARWRRQILANTYDLLLTALVAFAAQLVVSAAFRFWAENDPESLVDHWGSIPVALLWTFAAMPTLLVCAIAVAAHVLRRAWRPFRAASRAERGARRSHRVERPHRAFVEFPPRRGIPTGVRSIDLALCGSGWRPGLNGISTTGLPAKAVTAFLLAAVGWAQKSGMQCAWVGPSIDGDLGERMGANVSRIHVLPPEDEDPARSIEIAHGLATSRIGFGLVVIQSLPSLAGRPDLEGALNDLVASLHERQVACVYVDGSSPVPGAEGSISLCSYSTTRLVLSEDLGEHDGSIPDHRIKARVHKGGGRNGYAATFDLIYDRGITDDLLTPWSLVRLGLDLGALTMREGEGVFLHTEQIGLDERDAKRHLAADPDLAFELQIVIRERINALLDLT